MAEQKLKIVITGDSKEAENSLGSLSNQFAAGAIKADLLKFALNLAKDALQNVVVYLKQSIGESAKAEKEVALLTNSMKQMEIYTTAAAKQAATLSGELQTLTTFTDDEFNAAQRALIQQGVQGDMLTKLTKATADLAIAKDMGLAQAAELVAKSVGTETNALAKYGITVEESASKTERAENTVKELNRVFGGAAAADANTYGGQIKQIGNLWSEIQETIGSLITENEGFKIVMAAVKDALLEVNKWLIKN